MQVSPTKADINKIPILARLITSRIWIKWAEMLARIVFPVAIPIFAWIVCLVFVAVADKAVNGV